MSESILEQMLYEGLLPEQGVEPLTQEYQDTAELRDIVEGELRGQLSTNAVELFETYKEYVGKLTEMRNEACTVYGLSLGIRLTAEAYSFDNSRRL